LTIHVPNVITNLRIVVSFRDLGMELGNHGERQGVPRLRRRHRDGGKTVVHRGLRRRQESNVPDLDSGDNQSFQHG